MNATNGGYRTRVELDESGERRIIVQPESESDAEGTDPAPVEDGRGPAGQEPGEAAADSGAEAR